MADRAFMYAVENIQPSGTPGVFQIVAPVAYFDDVQNTMPRYGNICVDVNWSTMTAGQIQAAIVAAIIELGQMMDITIQANNSQIIIPTFSRV